MAKAATWGGTGLQPIRRRRLADIAYDEIRDRIVRGVLPMGSRLNEVQLASDLGVSRAPVREAIRRLTEDGLAVEQPHHGAVVRRLDGRSLVDLYNVRAGLEAVAIRLATRRRMDVAPLRRLIADMAAAARRGDHALVARHELRFHAVLCAGSGNEVLAGIFRILEGQLRTALAIDDSFHADLAEVATEHEPLVAAIEAGDEDAAARVVERHILSTVREAIVRLGGSPGELLG
jgi:DNA-binding GntR family transcriptional regulator